jgi:acyl-CoA synthetase (AMP-forming)/AMP-acid ligase II
MRPSILPALLDKAATLYGQRDALAFEDRAFSYAELAAAANRVARSLSRYGVASRDRVALWLPKSFEAIAATWGILRAGAVYVPIDPLSPPARVATVLRDAGATALITFAPYAGELVRDFDANLPVRAVWYADSPADPPAFAGLPVVNWNEVQNESPEKPLADVGPEDLACLQYTSGSTGKPKGAMISHRALVHQAQWTCDFLGLHAEDRVPGYAPMHTGMFAFEQFTTVCAGCTTYPVPHQLAPFPTQVVQ